MTPFRTGCRRPLVTALAVATLMTGTPALAAHRARLSADLEDHLRAGSPSVNVIVHGTRDEVDALAARYNLTVVKRLKHGAVLRVSAGDLTALQQDEAVDHLSSDVRYRSAGDLTAQTVGADQVWAGADNVRGRSGRGVGVAVIDSGVDPTHAALKGRILASVDFTGGDGIDRFGHGTHVAATIAGNPGRLAETGEYRGIATGAGIVNLRVLGDDGSGFASSVIEAIDWAVDNRRAYNIQVINLSLGAPVVQPYRDDPVCEAVQRAVAAGIVVVASAGNFGQTQDGRLVFGGITSPGNDPHVITVGAVDMHGTAVRSDDTVARYSSRGPTRYDLVVKPDLVAPGSRVVSAEAGGAYLSATYPERHVAGSGADAYMQLSGTSMAAGVVSGAVALLLEETPKLTPRDAKTILQVSSSLLEGEGLLSAGAGSLNIVAAAELLDFGSRLSSAATEISGEAIQRGGLTFYDLALGSQNGVASQLTRGVALLLQLRVSETVVRTTHDTIIWGQRSGDTIIWGQSKRDTIIWGQNSGNTIIWGQKAGDTIIWGQDEPDTIIWGQDFSETIIWGQDVSDTIIWGQSTPDTIIWGQGSVGNLD